MSVGRALPLIALGIMAPMIGRASPVSGPDGLRPIPAFARKYHLSCNVCHTREPRLNAFGQRFQENGYQLPGTQDGGVTAKALLGGEVGGTTLDEVTNFLAVRIRAEAEQPLLRENTVPEKPTLETFPTTMNVFFGGSATKNVGFFFEMEFSPRESDAVSFERVIFLLDNLFGYQRANLRIGKLDPSAFFSFPTHRQQLNPIGPEADAAEFPPRIDRIPVLPLAFAAKMFGLTRGPGAQGAENFSILPFEPLLFDAPAVTSAMLYGRPFGDVFMYAVGVAQDRTAEDSPDFRYDPYGMLRLDFIPAAFTDVQVSGFFYHAPQAARPTLAPMGTPIFAQPVDWNRWGAAARVRYKFLDLYGTAIWDEIDDPVFPGPPLTLSEWDTQGFGSSVEGDWVVTQAWMVGLRWDYMDPGGLVTLPPALQMGDPEINQTVSFLGGILKFYPVPSGALYARAHVNLSGSEKLPAALGGGEHPARNLQFIGALGVDMHF